ncbi:hypothetical protein EXIGLDRAFT_749662 [Exidia glandulosa HHB12029]|uniref:Uncharacterized protein n=1 Tax=Exidia glandulosa HHB12029 TaxID=1314781 RepID=A0A165HT49_EXIGL|nr:hypothetical protein EXIGLDRAFT_749662 [Exidia glandulosa HHB12029]
MSAATSTAVAAPPVPKPLAWYAALDQAARVGLMLPPHRMPAPTDKLAHNLAHTIAFLMERYLRACKDAGVDGGPHLIDALRVEHELVNADVIQRARQPATSRKTSADKTAPVTVRRPVKHDGPPAQPGPASTSSAASTKLEARTTPSTVSLPTREGSDSAKTAMPPAITPSTAAPSHSPTAQTPVACPNVRVKIDELMAHVYKIIRHPSTDLSTTNADRIRAMLVAHGHASAEWMARADVSETLDHRIGRALTLVDKERHSAATEKSPNLPVETPAPVLSDAMSPLPSDDALLASPVVEEGAVSSPFVVKPPVALPLKSPTPMPKSHESDELPLGWVLAPRALRSGDSPRHTEIGKGKAVTVLAKNDSTSALKRKDSSATVATTSAVVDDAVEMEKQMLTTQGSTSECDEGAIVPIPIAGDEDLSTSAQPAVRSCSIPAASTSTNPSPVKETADVPASLPLDDVHRLVPTTTRTLRKSKSVSFAEDGEEVVKPRFVPPFPLPFASLPVPVAMVKRNLRLAPPTVAVDLGRRTTANLPSAPAESASTITVPKPPTPPAARKPAKVARGKATTTTAGSPPSPATATSATLPKDSASLATQKISSPSKPAKDSATPTPTPAQKKLPRVSLRVTDPAVKRKREEEEEADEEEFEASFMRKRRIV